MSIRPALVLIVAMAEAQCAVSGPPRDGAAATQIADGGETSIYINVPLPEPPCAPPVAASCATTTQRYALDGALGRCVPIDGCEATQNTLASLAECEAACAPYLHCGCQNTTGPCPGLCAICPAPDSFDNLTDRASGQACSALGLECNFTAPDGVPWGCTCVVLRSSTTAAWTCGIVDNG
jgi:hypothetical protein